MFGFLLAARKGQNELAVRYLNTNLQGHAAVELVHELFTVIDRRLPANLTEISDRPEGSLSNLLMPDKELVGTISSNQGKVDIFLERVDRKNSRPVWLFASETLNSIPSLYAESNAVPVENVLPGSLMNNRFAGIPLFEWLAVLVGIPLYYFLTVLLNRLLTPLVGKLRRRLYKKSELPDFELFPGPIRLLLLACTIHWMISKISLPLLGRQFWSSVASIITIAGCVWLVILFNRRGEKYLRRPFQKRSVTGTTSMLRLGRRVVDLLALFAGLLVALHYVGVNPTAELAGIGIGGIVVAFAAQKSLENLISGISLIFDKAMRVGDVIKVGETLGTVEDIGLRSTRIRTLDRTLNTVPNGQIGDMTIEGISSRDKFGFHPILTLCSDTTSSQLQNCPRWHPQSAEGKAGSRVRFNSRAFPSIGPFFSRRGFSLTSWRVIVINFSRSRKDFSCPYWSAWNQVVECVLHFRCSVLQLLAPLQVVSERLFNTGMAENKLR